MSEILLTASINGDIDMVSRLLVEGSDPNAMCDGETYPLIEACTYGHYDVVSLLLRNGANPNVVNGRSYTPLMAIMDACIGVSCIERDSIVDNSILLDLVVDGRHLYLVDMIVSNGGGDLRTRYEDGNTLLIEAVLSLFPSIQIVNRLIREKGVDIDAQNDRGRTALMEASIRGNLYIVRVLLTHGAQPNIRDNEGNTALMMASRRGSINVCRELLSHGAYTYIKNNNGDTVSSMAATHDIRNLINSHPSSIYSTGGRV